MINEALLREHEQESLGLRCVDWYLCYENYDAVVNTNQNN
jgi:hypothetical protein